MATKTATNTKTLLTVKVDKQLKAKAQKTADDIGLPLGTVVNGFLRQFVVDKSMLFSIPEIPNARTRAILRKADEDRKTGKNVSPAFSNAKDAIAYLRSHR